jgi:AraC-like DNA-binding protein
MAEGGKLTFTDPDGYAAAFSDARVNMTITGGGDFEARLTRLKLNHLQVYRCYESLPRIAYISLPPAQIVLSFPLGTTSLVSDGVVLRGGDMVLHRRGEGTHQRSEGACQWGLISLSREELENYRKALTGRKIAPPNASSILHPARADVAGFQRLFRQACHLAEARQELIERPEVARALQQEMLYAIVHCLTADSRTTRRRQTVVMGRFEESLSKYNDQMPSMPKLCTEIRVAERTLRMCCAKFLGVSPTRYLLLRRLNKARSALRRANPSMATVAEVARNHQFLELGRFAVTYRTIFGESPSVTLGRTIGKDKTQRAGRA